MSRCRGIIFICVDTRLPSGLYDPLRDLFPSMLYRHFLFFSKALYIHNAALTHTLIRRLILRVCTSVMARVGSTGGGGGGGGDPYDFLLLASSPMIVLLLVSSEVSHVHVR